MKNLIVFTFFLTLFWAASAQTVRFTDETETPVILVFESQDSAWSWSDTIIVHGELRAAVPVISAHGRIKEVDIPEGNYKAWFVAGGGLLIEVAALTKYRSGLVKVY